MSTPSHRERTKAEAENSRGSRKAVAKRTFITVTILTVVVVVAMVLKGILAGAPKTALPAPSVTPTGVSATDDANSGAWKLTVVSVAAPLSHDFTVDLEALDTAGEVKVDTRIAPILKQLLWDAKNADASFTICSGYRNVAKQKNLYEREIQGHQARGLSLSDAIMQAERYVQPPGSSEHHTGLAIDLLAPGEGELSENFSTTAAGRWLSEHAQDYGLILRYPQGKEEITGIAWEPWHYRYVGREIAQIITANGICLEEYVADPSAYKLPQPSPEPSKETTP